MRSFFNRSLLVGLISGCLAGAAGTYLLLSRSGDVAISTTVASQLEEVSQERGNGDPWETLRKFTGNWVSVDGRQTAELDYRTLQFESTAGWPDLERKSFLLGTDMQFLSDTGLYTIVVVSSRPDEMRMIKEDRTTRDLSSFNLYREGSSRARSLEPLPEMAIPLKVQALLDAIPAIRPGESKGSAMRRLGLADDKGLRELIGEKSLGQADEVWSLGAGDEWMLKLSYSEKALNRFQLVRGYPLHEGEDLDVFQYLYPYYVDSKIIAAPPSVAPRNPGPENR